MNSEQVGFTGDNHGLFKKDHPADGRNGGKP